MWRVGYGLDYTDSLNSAAVATVMKIDATFQHLKNNGNLPLF
jgi:hypothetical protein